MQINLKKVAEICAVNINSKCGYGKCPAYKICLMFIDNPYYWNIADMEETVKQFNREQNKKTYC